MPGTRLVFDLETDELEMFLEEVDEHLQAINDGILKLEREQAIETLNTTFRSAHTLKALAATVGHHAMADLTHAMESLFDALRSGGLVLTQGMVDDLLHAADALQAQRQELETGEPSGIETASLINRLRETARSQSAAPAGVAPPLVEKTTDSVLFSQLHTEERTRASALAGQGMTVVEVEACLADGAFAPSARLLQLALTLAEYGQVIAQKPSQEELSATTSVSTLMVILATEAALAELEQVILRSPDIAACCLRPLDLTEPTPPKPSVTGRNNTPEKSGGGLERTIRISVERLDTLMNLVGELVTDRNRLMEVGGQLAQQVGHNTSVRTLTETTDHIDRVVDQLQDEVMRARMLPIDYVFTKFPRIVRDAARAGGKKVELVIEGQDTELDRSVIETIGDPLMHLLRNAVDHGIEPPDDRLAAGKSATGTIRLTAAHIEGHIQVTVEDDGRGIDAGKIRKTAAARGVVSAEEAAAMSDDEAIELLFQPGFSTAEQVTELSGRGVGMDVVRTNIERLGGQVAVHSELGRGSRFEITLPLTLAILQGMLVSVERDVYAVPLATIAETTRLPAAAVRTVKGQGTLLWRDQVLPLINMHQYFSRNGNGAGALISADDLSLLIVHWGKTKVGLIVSDILGKQEVVVKSLNRIVGQPPGISGAAILGDGRVALILDVPGLIKHALQARKEGTLVWAP